MTVFIIILVLLVAIAAAAVWAMRKRRTGKVLIAGGSAKSSRSSRGTP